MDRTTKTLHLVEVVATHAYPLTRLRDELGGIEHNIRTFVPQNMAALVLQIHSLFAAENLEAKTVQYPADWWEALKARWFPAWALRRWPVRLRVETFDMKAIWQRFQPDPSMLKKYGPVVPYHLIRSEGGSENDDD